MSHVLVNSVLLGFTDIQKVTAVLGGGVREGCTEEKLNGSMAWKNEQYLKN